MSAMRSRVTHMPTVEHVPVARLDDTNGIPVISLDEAYGSVSLQFNPATPDVTIAYLTTLAAEASKLLDAVKAEVQS